MQDTDLENRFTYHPPVDAIQVEQSLALTHLEEVVFWSNAALARYDTVRYSPAKEE